MIYLNLAIEFIKISLFSFGGGYATLPFIYYLSSQYAWYSAKEILQMIAIAAVTPGAFGVNMATYTGFKVLGVHGALIATFALILPSYILSICVYKVLKKYKDTKIVNDMFEILRAIASGLLFVVALKMFSQEILGFKLSNFSFDFSINAFIYLCLSTIIYFIVRKNVLLTMIISIILGSIISLITTQLV